MLQHDEQAIEIADRAGQVAITTYDGGGLRGELWQHFGDLHEAHKVARFGRPSFHRFGIEHLHAAGAGIEMHGSYGEDH